MRTKIIYEDEDILVCHKMPGMAVETKSIRQTDMVSELKNYLAQKNNQKTEPYLAVIHRLDQPVEGILVFAKNKQVAACLSGQIQNGKMLKYYEAVCFGSPKETVFSLTDFLKKEERTNTSYVVDPEKEKDGKLSKLEAEVLSTECVDGCTITKLKIHLLTGRHHQIRVQCAHAGLPLVGDLKYGSEASKEFSEEQFIDTVQLKAVSLSFTHPKKGKMEFSL